jgi:hypothetical protein
MMKVPAGDGMLMEFLKRFLRETAGSSPPWIVIRGRPMALLMSDSRHLPIRTTPKTSMDPSELDNGSSNAEPQIP